MPLPASVPASIAGLRQAMSGAALRGMNSPVNLSGLDDVYSVNPHASAAEMLSSEANAGNATNALVNLGGGPQRLGLVNAMDDARLAHANDEQDQLADLRSGVPQQIASQKLAEQNALADTASEASASRQMLPAASALSQRDTASKINELYTRYVQPEEARGQALVGAAHEKAGGDIAVEQQKNSPDTLKLKALLETLSQIMGKKGKAVDPTTATGVGSAFGIK